MAELKPCPFCGAEALMEVQRHVPEGNDYMPKCSVASCAGRIVKRWRSREAAVAAWNRRYAEMGAKLLTLEQAVRREGLVWLEEVYSTDVIPAKCVWHREAPEEFVNVYTLTIYSPEVKEVSKYGLIWRCWTKEPTDKERRNAAWGGER